MLRQQDGFTILEILASVAIVTILAAIFAGFSDTYFQDSRDDKRKADLASLAMAIMAHEEVKEAYPSTGDVWFSSEPGDAAISNNNGNWVPGLVPEFLPKLPRDPNGGRSSIAVCNNGEKRAFRYRSNGKNGFKLMTHCSMEGPIIAGSENLDPIRPDRAFMICSGGPACSW